MSLIAQSFGKRIGKSVCILGSKGEVSSPYLLSSSQFLQKCGQNTGNLLFQYACTKIFEDISLGNIGHDVPYRHDYVNKNCDFLILPCANFLNPKFDLTSLCGYLEKVTIPIIPIGLGAQSESFADEFPSLAQLPQSIQDLIKIIRDKSPVIFVRGELTFDVLTKCGIDKDRIKVLGCPSNFIGNSKFMRDSLFNNLLIPNNELNLLITGDEVWPKNGSKRTVERKLVKLLTSRAGGYLVQSVEPLVEAILSCNRLKISAEFRDMLHHIGFEDSLANPKSFLRLYASVESWMFGIGDISLSTGLRLHGNMCSFQRGIPALWIFHDSRTRELCETMRLPSISLEDANFNLDKGSYIDKAKEIIQASISNYFARRESLYDMFRRELEKIDLHI